ncbi:MAG: hypothetical protein MPEBLZ_02741 [Candidatus Methanoperedens nitroreducens]|uniref:Uncharacterized protein n=1 Tax=Candidatus Methanoperedens nitratireducens TaxID=1392998 RepID=A0A0P8DY77_9EURY|nr:DUF5676 family membrane protein [Candidatus Methanoperedens sp. BLZ2]KAB2947717.1 MAG: MotA/TolQ/ExbB proton channel family protein [Candidatus Methanoperedens sp.]KPQ42724.1 MAG: hypothetical protein MPEBLZ_02741 [Candidatus Methanoperedens sp. BLZ1]MBZ0176221.1 DUF5676 family membrane protein [Candidatus Methanoperedens nitroreducens]MCX9077447.1 DUF5676 family membrane protein [Candidatus Methanoperedens sp.]
MYRLYTKVVALSLGVFLAVIYVICVIFDLLWPVYEMRRVWPLLLPGFTWLTPSSFLLGLAESFVWGLLAGIIFVPIYNYFVGRFAEMVT